jgi:hypothetical protein
MRCEPPDCRTYQALRSLNAGFLSLAAGADLSGDGAHLGLHPAIRQQLRRLTPAELEFIAGTPSLLAGFAASATAVDRLPGGVAEVPDQPSAWPTAPSDAARVFAAALLTFLWQMDRHDQLIKALCIGSVERLPELTVARIQLYAGQATHRLRARFADHPCFWPDLMRAARSQDGDLRSLSRLSVIPLVLAEGRTTG